MLQNVIISIVISLSTMWSMNRPVNPRCASGNGRGWITKEMLMIACV